MPIFVRGHYKVTVTRYVVETLFIIIERYVKLYKFDRVEIVNVRFSVIALNHDISGRSHFTEIISHSFSILSSVERPAFLVRVLLGVINNVPFFLAIIANVTHLLINLHTCVVPKNLLGPFLWL